MPKLGLTTSLGSSGLTTPGVVTDGLVMKHMYPAGAVQPLSDGSAYFRGPGDDDYIDCGAINVGTTFSAGGWFWINSSGQDQYTTLLGQAIYDSIGAHIEGFILRLSTNNLQLSFGDDSIGANDSITITNFLTTTGNTNNWVHLYFTISADATGSKISKLYQNGALIATDTNVNFEGAHSSSNFTIGKADNLNAGDSALKGYASNVSLYSTELTEAQIKSIMWKQYADLSTTEKTSLVSWWNLDNNLTTQGSSSWVADEVDTTFGSNITPTWTSSNGAVIDGQTITLGSSGVVSAAATISPAGVYKVNVTVTGYTGSGTIEMPWDGGGNSNMRVSANGTYEFYEASADTSWAVYAADGVGGTITINSITKANGNIGELL